MAVVAQAAAPRLGKRDAANALAAARGMSQSMAGWNRERSARGEPASRVGIGLHWGSVVLGDIGGANRLEFATVGDTVTVASRLERLTRELGVEIAVSADLAEAVRAVVPAVEADALLDGFGRTEPRLLRGRGAQLDILVRSVSP